MSESWFVGEHGYIGLDCIDRAERRARERYEAERDWGTDLAGLIARPFHLLALALSPGRQAEERARIKEILAEELGKLEEPTKEQAPLLRMQGVTLAEASEAVENLGRAIVANMPGDRYGVVQLPGGGHEWRALPPVAPPNLLITEGWPGWVEAAPCGATGFVTERAPDGSERRRYF